MLFVFFDPNSEIRASKLAELATAAKRRVGNSYFPIWAEFQNAFGTEVGAEVASLAPVGVDIYFVFRFRLGFRHCSSLF